MRFVVFCVVGALVAACGESEKDSDGGDSGGSSGGAASTGGGSSSNGGSQASGSGGSTAGGSSGSSDGGSISSGGAEPGGSGGDGGSATAELPTEAELLAAAVVLGSCWPDDGINRNLTRLREQGLATVWYDRFGFQAKCLGQTGGGCDAVTQCLGYSAGPAPSCSAGCAGDVITACGDGRQIAIDCSKLGLECSETAFCSEGPTASCDFDTFEPTCNADGRPEHCDGSDVLVGPACADYGLECAAGYCTGTGDQCLNYDSSFEGEIVFDGVGCSGDVLDACVEGKLAQRDCTEINPDFSCQSFDEVYFCGLASECEPGMNGWHGTPETCDGTEVVFCNAGRIERIDCVDLGFTGCEILPAQQASCTPTFADP